LINRVCMKVLICCTTDTWGGLEQTAFRDAVRLRDMGVETAILSLNKGAIYEKAREHKIELYTVSSTESYFSYGVFKKIKKLCSSKKFDVVHLHSFNTIFSMLLALKLVKIPVVATRHIYVEHMKKDLFHKWYLGRIDRMLAISEFSRRNIIDTYPIEEQKIETLYLGIDLNKYTRDEQKAAEFKKQFAIADNIKVIGVVGRIDPAKGQMEFINAIPEIIKEHPATHFVIVGKTTADKELDYLAKLKNNIRDLGVGSFVTFTGFCSDVSIPMSALDIFVMPSYFEAFGLIAIEAMACKVPVVATNMGSIEEIIPNYDYGIKVLPKNSEQIADAVKILLSDPALCETITKNAYSFVSEKFNEQTYFNRLTQVYKDLLKESSTN
jgi:glycosyltransferase involved in cell wall biosynthesis